MRVQNMIRFWELIAWLATRAITASARATFGPHRGTFSGPGLRMHHAQCSISFGITATYRAGCGFRFCRGVSPTFCGVEYGAGGFIRLNRGRRIFAVEFDLFSSVNDNGALGAHHHFTISSETISINRRIGDNNLFIRVPVVIRCGKTQSCNRRDLLRRDRVGRDGGPQRLSPKVGAPFCHRLEVR